MADLSGLLAELSADSPCGENLEYDNARVALDADIQGTPENQFSGEKAAPPNWREVNKQALALLQKSKDLQVILYLIRSLIPLEGLCGFRDGLNLLESSISAYWDCIHPQLDPDDGLDPTIRVNILEELCSFDLVLKPLSLVMLVESKAVGRFCLRDIQYATDKVEVPEGTSKPDVSVIRAAFLDVDDEALHSNYQAVLECISLVASLEAFVGEKVGISQGPGLSSLKSLLNEIRHNFEQYAEFRLGDTSDEAEIEDDGDVETGAVQPPKIKTATGAIESRQDVLRVLDALCKYYAEYEPSSPVPILLRRAKHLATADFMEIVQNLIPDGLSQLDTIKGPDLE